jgi:deoxyribodipyrimidine photo-lyase
MQSEDWTPDKLSEKSNGKRTGWWGTGKNAEAFLDELVTWREIGFNMCTLTSNFDSYDSLPDWSRKTLADHQSDLKEFYYEIDEFENAKTHDNIWNAAQNELVRTGKIHNYLRMLWGKKILEWSVTPKRSMEIMIELNNKYALDGRDPNSYSGIFWILGRYDRPWGPERSIFGKIRYMSSERTRGKIDLKNYLTIYN